MRDILGICQISNLLLLSVITVLVGCATSPDELPTTYVSPLKYKDYSCDQIVMEMDYVSKKTGQLYQSLDKKADNDSAQMGVGMILFWPALFALEGGDGPEAQEYSNLKGEFEALRTASVQKNCSMENAPKSPKEVIEEYKEQKENMDENGDDVDEA